MPFFVFVAVSRIVATGSADAMVTFAGYRRKRGALDGVSWV